MGILNVTPDSFSDGGRFPDADRAVDRCLQMVAEGADFVDIGGESSRPGARPVSVAEELSRVLPVITRLRPQTNAFISIDTTKSEVAKEALAAGADIVNDISSLRFDPDVAVVASEAGAGLVLMQMRGTPATMQQLPPSTDLFGEVLSDLQVAVNTAYKCGISRDRILLDPGIGFGKTSEQNLQLMNRLWFLSGLGCPVLVGPSRKSFIGKVLNRSVDDRLFGTAAACAVCALRGAHVLRVHDVEEIRQVVDVVDSLSSERIGN